MPRFFLPSLGHSGEAVEFPPEESAHASRVLRLKTGTRVELLNGRGLVARAELTGVGRKQLRAKVISQEDFPAPAPGITLFQSVIKGRHMDWVIQKATELGVTRIVPTLCERSVPDFSPREAEKKRARWESIATEALKQCGLPWLPRIEAPVPLDRCLTAGSPPPISFLGALVPGVQHLRDALEALQPESNRGRECGVWLGPEGDFTSGELELIQAIGAIPASLGPRVLRSETAALVFLAVLNNHFRR